MDLLQLLLDGAAAVIYALTAGVLGNASFLEITFAVIGLLTLRHHWRNRERAKSNLIDLASGVKEEYITPEEADELRVAPEDRKQSETAKLVVQGFFILLAVSSFFAPAPSIPIGRVIAFFVGVGAIVVQYVTFRASRYSEQAWYRLETYVRRAVVARATELEGKEVDQS